MSPLITAIMLACTPFLGREAFECRAKLQLCVKGKESDQIRRHAKAATEYVKVRECDRIPNRTQYCFDLHMQAYRDWIYTPPEAFVEACAREKGLI